MTGMQLAIMASVSAGDPSLAPLSTTQNVASWDRTVAMVTDQSIEVTGNLIVFVYQAWFCSKTGDVIMIVT
jgi:hypothetical protein